MREFIFCVATLLTLFAIQVQAETVTIECEHDQMFRYKDSWFSKPTVMRRDRAAWVPFCDGTGRVSDLGATCEYYGKIEHRYRVSVNNEYISKARKTLADRLQLCRKWQSKANAAKPLKKAPWLARLVLDCSTDDQRNALGWNYYYSKPANEQKEFWLQDDEAYFRRHLPKVGRQIGSVDLVEKQITIVDFIKSSYAIEKYIGDKLTYRSGSQKCKQVRD